MNCTVKIVTISGATDVKESSEYFETIRIISTSEYIMHFPKRIGNEQ